MAAIAQHFILTLGRSGSNTLVNILNQHPAVLNLGEVLGEWNAIRRLQRRLRLDRGRNDAYLDALLSRRSLARSFNLYRSLGCWRRGEWRAAKRFGGIRTLGVKEFSLNLARHDLADYLGERPHIRVIGLQRHNIMDRFLSNSMLAQTGQVAAYAGKASTTRKLHLNPDSLAAGLAVIDDENRALSAMLDALPPARVFRIAYEDLYAAPAQTFRIIDDVYRFLGVEPFRPVMKMRKIIAGGAIDTIANPEDCRAALRGTKFASLLD